MARRPDTTASQTRRAILDAALDLFATHSYHGSSIRGIARAAGVRESSIYHHFPSKEAILEAVVGEFADFGRMLAESQLEVVDKLSFPQVLTNLAGAIAKQMARPDVRKGVHVGRTLGLEALKADSQILRYRERNLRLFHQMIGRLKALGHMRKDVVPEFFGMTFVAPLIIASGLFADNAPALPPAQMKKFLKAHVAAMVRAYGRGNS